MSQLPGYLVTILHSEAMIRGAYSKNTATIHCARLNPDDFKECSTHRDSNGRYVMERNIDTAGAPPEFTGQDTVYGIPVRGDYRVEPGNVRLEISFPAQGPVASSS